MTKTRCVLLYGILVLLFSSPLIGQTLAEKKITIDFRNLPVGEVLQKISNETKVPFYFKQEDIPNQSISGTFGAASLDEVLKSVLDGTTLGHLFYKDYAVVLMPKLILNETFTADYYNALERAKNDPESQALVVGDIKKLNPSGNAMVSGLIQDEQTKEPIIGATILLLGTDQGTSTDADGQFELTLPAGKHQIRIQYVGYDDLAESIEVFSDGEITFDLAKSAIQLEEVTVTAETPDESVQGGQIGVARLDIESVKKGPNLLGEADVVRSLLLTAGVSTIGEGASGFNVRGGDVDQNLILQDDATLLNSSHALGFFSTFNTDLISKVELFKANMPAQYGGRLASVMDVELKDGDYQKFKAKAGVGPVSSKISFEGPVLKDKISFIGGFRASYTDWILDLIQVREVQNSSAFFYDANLKLSIKANSRNTISLAAYSAQDEFFFNDEFGFDYQTLYGQLLYRTIFSDQLFNKFSVTASRYESSQFDVGGVDGAQLDNNVDYLKVKEQLTYNPNNDFKVDVGFGATYYIVDPGTRTPFGDSSSVTIKTLEEERGLESSVFGNVEYSLSDKLLFSGGLRATMFNFLGPATIFQYDGPLLQENIVDTTSVSSGSIATYWSFEPRVSLRYRLGPTSSVKAGYSRTAQFINQIFNSASPTPTSQWQLSTDYIEPTRSHNYSIGYFRNFEENMWETSAEIYYRDVDQIFDFKDFAELAVNEHLETELLSGQGRTYGLELSIKKKTGKLNGTLTYTLSRSERLIEGINDDDWYNSNFDKPHDLSFVFNFQPNRRNTFSVNFVYGSGRPTTAPVGNYKSLNGLTVPLYSDRNQVRIPDYHRLDLAYTLGKGYKRDQKFQTSWTISIYNVYGRQNAFSVFFTQAAFQATQANKLAILGSAFPSITFNLEVL